MFDVAGSEKHNKVPRNLGGLFKRDEVAGIYGDQLRIRDQSGGTAGEGLRQYVTGTVDHQGGACQLFQDRWKLLKDDLRLPPADQPHQPPGSANATEGSGEASSLRGMACAR